MNGKVQGNKLPGLEVKSLHVGYLYPKATGIVGFVHNPGNITSVPLFQHSLSVSPNLMKKIEGLRV